jgi:putative glycosyltransferase (TIGR04372 family)
MLGALILLCVQAIKPLVRVRIGLLVDERIGHLAANTEYLLRKEYPKRQPKDKFLLLSTSKPANHQLVVMFNRIVPIISSSRLYSIMSAANKQWPELAVWLDLSSLGPSDFELWSNSRTQLAFTDEEVARGKELLHAMGIPDGAPFVCFAIRDKSYLAGHMPEQSWRHHDYRDADIENCRLMAEWLAAQGIWVIRMGATVEKPFKSGNPRIIDYANRYRSDFGDIFLLGTCKFFVGDTAGIFWPAAILGVPVALTNLVPINHLCPLAGSMVMLKKYRRSKTEGLISYKNVVESGFDGFLDTQQHEAAGIELVENTAEEILGMAQELNARIDGTWISTPEDEDLHARFWSIFPKGHPSHGCPARVPIEFLRRNRDLFI